MTFFNKKTDVMDIELTPYGRYLLSIGKLKPKYYDFTDDDVLYDVTADGVSSENPEHAHNRIVTNTPKLKTLYLKKGVESDSLEDYSSPTTMNVNIENIRGTSQEVSYNQKEIYCLGRSSYETQNLPSFQVTALKGQITGSTGHLSSSITQLPIPQIDMEYILVASIENMTPTTQDSDPLAGGRIGNKYIKLSRTDPIIHLKEFGSFYEKENFDIEVFEVLEYKYKYQGAIVPVDQRYESLRQLSFVKKNKPIVNDMLLDDGVGFNENFFSNFNVESYFDIKVDNEISREEICQAVDKLEVNSQFLDEEIICPDVRSQRFDIYRNRIDPNDLEDCD